MNISSTPFIRNDYWPDYNELNELNGRINEVENELSLTNIFLNDRIENVENNLNTYIAGQNNTVTTNNIVVNNINANYAAGDYLNFNNINADNIYVENLIVNKPAFNVVLNTPHIENVTSLGGNIFNANIIDCEINTDNIFVNNLNVAQGTAETFKVTGDLIINKNIEPVSSSAVLGYDPTGKVIPVRATYDVSFPEDANYLYTDHFGTAYAGTAATEVGISSNLITAHAVKNAIDNVTADVSDNFNIVNDALNDVDSWMNNIENDVNNRFEDVANNFNDVNNFVNDGFNDVANNFNDVANKLNEANNTINSLRNTIRILSGGVANYYDSNAPVNYKNVTRIIFRDAGTGTQILGGHYPVNIGFDSTSNILKFSSQDFKSTGKMDENLDAICQPNSVSQIFNSDISYLFASCNHLNYAANIENGEFNFNFCTPNGNYITNMERTFAWCDEFNMPVQIPDSVTTMRYTFTNCFNFNQPVQIPDSVIGMYAIFSNCTSLNQNIKLPNNITNLDDVFEGCTNFNQNILIPDSVTDMYRTFQNCSNLNQNILIPNSVTNMTSCFKGCTKLNQNILIPNSVTNMSGTFSSCANLNQNILIPNSVTDMKSTFLWCNNLNQNILIPNSVTNMSDTFSSCANLNQNILIPNSVTNMSGTFSSCNNLNQPDMYIYSQNINRMYGTFDGCHINNIHVPTSVPKSTSNYMYNCLVNGLTGITFPAANIFNDLPVDIEQWPPL